MRSAKTDGNQTLIVDALRAVGCSVQPLHTVGQGVPDLLVGIAGKNALIEVKDPAQPVSARRLNPIQKRWHAEWKGTAHVVETVEQALSIVALMQGRLVRP